MGSPPLGGEPYKVFTPFWRAWADSARCRALPVPAAVGPAVPVEAEALAKLGLLPTKPDWAGGLRDSWKPGEPAATAALDDFLEVGRGLPHGRDFPARPGVSRLSPRLHHGELSPRQIWHAAQRERRAGIDAFLRQLVWREFAYHLLYHFPHMHRHAAAARIRQTSPGRTSPACSRLAAGPDRLSAGRRRHARALAHGLDAQPGADGRRPRS